MRSVRISAKHARELVRLLEHFPATYPGLADSLRKALEVRPAVKSRRVRTAARKETKEAETTAIRTAVTFRACGNCEACGREFSPADPMELDHFFPKGRTPQTERTCWGIHASCHRAKILNRPDAAHWLRAFFAHAHRHEFWTEAAKARARLESLNLVKEAASAHGR